MKLVKDGRHYQYMLYALQLNQGNEIFSDIAQMSNVSNTDWSWSNLIADFENDGKKTLYVTNGLLRGIRNTDAAQSIPDYVRNGANQYIAQNPNTGDVHILDILDLEEGLSLIPSVPISNYAYRNTGNLQFENTSTEWGIDVPSFSNGSAFGDLDNDGDLELVVNNINAEAFIFKNLSVE